MNKRLNRPHQETGAKESSAAAAYFTEDADSAALSLESLMNDVVKTRSTGEMDATMVYVNAYAEMRPTFSNNRRMTQVQEMELKSTMAVEGVSDRVENKKVETGYGQRERNFRYHEEQFRSKKKTIF